MRAGLEGAASRAGVGGGPRPATLPRAPPGVDWSRSVSWRGSPTGSGRESLRQVVRAPPPSPCAQSSAGARAPAPPGLNSLPGGRSRTRRRGGVPPLPTGTPTGVASGVGAVAGDPESQPRLRHLPMGDPVLGPGGSKLSRVKERVLRGVVAGWIPPTALGLAPKFLSQLEAEARPEEILRPHPQQSAQQLYS